MAYTRYMTEVEDKDGNVYGVMDEEAREGIAELDEKIGTVPSGKTTQGQIDDLKENKAEVDGYYEDMTVGDAEQLVATVGVEDKVPYNFRTAGGSADIGDRLVDKLIGGTVGWNQHVTTNTNPVKTKTAAVVSVEDAVAGNASDVKAKIEPVQDLHGYDNPWPAGGGKNLLPLSVANLKAINTTGAWNDDAYTESNVTYTIQTDNVGNIIGINVNGTASANSFFKLVENLSIADGTYILNGSPSDANADTFALYAYTGTIYWDQGSGVSVPISSNTVNVNIRVLSGETATNKVFRPMVRLSSVSDATFAPYSNICPISGWTGANVSRTGKNLSSVNSLSTNPGIYWETDDVDMLAMLNTLSVGTYTIACTYEITEMPGNGKIQHGRPYITALVNGVQNAVLSYSVVNDESPTLGKKYRDGGTFTITESIKGNFNHCYFYCDQKDTHTGNERGRYNVIDIQLELGSTETAYEPYNGTTYPISWQTEAGTVYGGTLTVNEDGTGSLVVDRIVAEPTSVTGSQIDTLGRCFIASPNTVPLLKDINKLPMCDRLKSTSSTDATFAVSQYGGASQYYFIYLDSSYNSVSKYNEWLSENKPTIVLWIATPVTYTLSELEVIEMLNGLNNVWADTGDTILTYAGAVSEVTCITGRKYLTKKDGTWSVVSGAGQTITGNKNADMIVDLTQMFGSTIADYIYALETGTPGAGVAWFRKLFPKDYYAYDAGSLQSVQAKSHITRGFNAWDEEWEVGTINGTTGANENNATTIRAKNMIPVIPGTKYYYHNGTGTTAGGRYYDANGNYVVNASLSADYTFVVPTNVYFMRFVLLAAYGTTYKNDICINLSWDGERDGEYEAYNEHAYPLDADLVLRGIPKLDSNNKLYYDGDVYESDGTVTRKYGIVDLGTLSWNKSTSGLFLSNSLQSLIKYGVSGERANIACKLYLPTTPEITGPNGTNPSPDKVMAVGTIGSFYVNDLSYTDAGEFKTAMSGVYLVYELATPTTESADPFQNPQIVDDFGTEEYVDAGVTASTPTRDVAIPVGHETTYRQNLRAKLEMAPDSPDSNGDFLMRHSNGENEYVPYESPVPAAPTTDGTYVLKATVLSGTATLSWVAEE